MEPSRRGTGPCTAAAPPIGIPRLPTPYRHNVPHSLAIHLSVDNHVIQKRPKVKAWLASRPRYHLHAPPYACRINSVEHRFGFIPQQDIRRGSFSSVKELTRKINAFVEQYNARGSPFNWAATAESIRAKPERLGSLLPGTRH